MLYLAIFHRIESYVGTRSIISVNNSKTATVWFPSKVMYNFLKISYFNNHHYWLLRHQLYLLFILQNFDRNFSLMDTEKFKVGQTTLFRLGQTICLGVFSVSINRIYINDYHLPCNKDTFRFAASKVQYRQRNRQPFVEVLSSMASLPRLPLQDCFLLLVANMQ